MTKPTLVEFPGKKMGDVAAMLRTIADEIEAGKHPAPHGVLVLARPEDDWPAVFGLGPDGIPPNCVWLLELAKAFLITSHCERS